MVYEKLGRYPLSISVKVRMIKFWANVINCNTSKLTGISYLLALRNHNINSIRSPWISFIKGILDTGVGSGGGGGGGGARGACAPPLLTPHFFFHLNYMFI